MSNATHDNQTKLQFWIDDDLLTKLDEIIAHYGYASRSEWLREQIRVEIKDFNSSSK